MGDTKKTRTRTGPQYRSGKHVDIPPAFRKKLREWVHAVLFTQDQICAMFYPDANGQRPRKNYISNLISDKSKQDKIGVDGLRNLERIMKDHPVPVIPKPEPFKPTQAELPIITTNGTPKSTREDVAAAIALISELLDELDGAAQKRVIRAVCSILDVAL